MAIIYQESKFIANARTPVKYVLGVLPMGRQSSAYGYAQALDGTWDEYKRATRNSFAKRDQMDDAADFIGWYANESWQRNGIGFSDARNQYLAYHDGQTGYRRGTYKRKGWLMRIAGEVEDRSQKYKFQLEKCNRFR